MHNLLKTNNKNTFLERNIKFEYRMFNFKN